MLTTRGSFPGTQFTWQGQTYRATGSLAYRMPSSSSSGGTTPSVPPVIPLDPNELANATYGKPMPFFAGGLARIGGAIIFGPEISNGAASFGVSFGVPANVTGTRALFEIALDSKVAWTSTAGTTNIAAGTFMAEAFTARFYQGTLTQSVDALETAKYGSSAIAYRPQMLIFFQNLPLAQFNNKIPYVAAVIGDTTGGADPTDGINLGEAIERVAHSPWAGYTSSTFETVDIVDVVQAFITSQNVSVVELCRNISRIYRNLDLIQTDKLRLVDSGATTDPDLVLTTDHIVSSDDGMMFVRQAPSTLPRELELITIDPDADYTPVPSLSQMPRDPVVVSASVGRETFSVPLIIDAATRQAMVVYAQYYDENARKKISGTLMARAYEVEPGDFIGFSELADGIEDEIFKVTETLHGANFTVEFTAEAIMRCAIPTAGTAENVACAYEGDDIAAATHTFTGISFGDADANRLVVVGLNLKMAATGQTITSVTIGGITATEAAVATHAVQGLISAIWYASVPTGTSGDVVVNTSGNMVDAAVGSYRLVTNNLTIQDTAAGTQNVTPFFLTIGIDVPAGGVAIVAAACRAGAALTWDGATESCNVSNEPDITGTRTTAMHLSASGEEDRDITVTLNVGDRTTMCAASWALS